MNTNAKLVLDEPAPKKKYRKAPSIYNINSALKSASLNKLTHSALVDDRLLKDIDETQEQQIFYNELVDSQLKKANYMHIKEQGR